MQQDIHPVLRDQLELAIQSEPRQPLAALCKLVNDTYRTLEQLRQSDRTTIQSLLDARTFVAAAFESIQQGVIAIDNSGAVRLFNEQACRLLSLPRETLEAQPLFTSLDVPSPMKNETTQSQELVTRVGRRLELIESALPCGGCVQTYLDVTGRRQREEQIRAAQAEFQLLFDNAIVGIYRCDLDGRLNLVNTAFAKLHGYNSVDKYFSALAEKEPDGRNADPAREEFLNQVATEGRVTDFTREIVRLRTGKPIWVTETAWIVNGSDGAPAYIEGTVVDATAERIAHRRIAYLAHHDHLTGLANREVFNRELTERLDPMNEDRSIALHCIDLDRFKSVNDSMGHICGDILLQVVSHRLRAVTHGNGLVARVGGDEFTFIQNGPVTRPKAHAMAEEILAALNEPYEVEGKLIEVGATLGVAVSPEDGETRDELFRNADLALCEGKMVERGKVHMFNPNMAEEVTARRMLELELRIAWSQRQFYLAFQPIVDISTGRPSSFEALLRWNRPNRAQVSPATFIPIAEELGLIGEIGSFVLKQACRKVSQYDDCTSVSVNVSAAQFRDRSIIRAVSEALEESGLQARRLVIEITETLLLHNDAATMECMESLYNMGVRLSLDDFGVGYSALSYLARFKFHEVKIDRTFIARIDESPVNMAIVRAILDICKSVGMSVVAEGVETQTQVERLRAMGCLRFQGYYFGKPCADLASAPSQAALSA